MCIRDSFCRGKLAGGIGSGSGAGSDVLSVDTSDLPACPSGNWGSVVLRLVFSSCFCSWVPSFHACVEQEDQVQEQKQEQEPESFQGKRLLRFLPPDGKFRLAQYVIDLDGQGGMSRRMDRDGLIQVSFEDGLGLNKDEFEVRLHVRESIAVVNPVEDLVVTLQFSNGNDSNVKMLRATHGTFVGQDEDRQCSWRFDSDEISAGTLPVLRGCIDDSKHVQQKKRSCLTSVAVRYGYPGELASGCRVTRLDVDVASPRVRGKVFKGVRCVTRVPALTVRA